MCPETIIHRSMFHIAHETGLWLTKQPQTEAAQELLYLTNVLCKVDSQPTARLWIRAFIDWYMEYKVFIKWYLFLQSNYKKPEKSEEENL